MTHESSFWCCWCCCRLVWQNFPVKFFWPKKCHLQNAPGVSAQTEKAFLMHRVSQSKFPRVNGALLNNYINCPDQVILVGELVSVENDRSYVLLSTDANRITVNDGFEGSKCNIGDLLEIGCFVKNVTVVVESYCVNFGKESSNSEAFSLYLITIDLFL